MIRADLVDKLAGMRAPENEQQLEEAFSNYHDPRWVAVKGCLWKGVWRFSLFGFASATRFRTVEISAAARDCLAKMTLSFETHAAHLQKQVLTVKEKKDATDFVQHDHEQILEVIQYLALSGMPWHLAQRWNLLSIAKIGDRVKEMDALNVRWIPTLFNWFGHEFHIEELNEKELAQFELFCWRGGWIDLLEDWARGDERKTVLLNNLKEIFRLTRCKNLFIDRGAALQALSALPPPPPVSAPKAAPKGLKRGGRHERPLQMDDIEQAPELPDRIFTNLVPRSRDSINLTEPESIRRYFIQRTLRDLARYRLKVPQEHHLEFQKVLLGTPFEREHQAQIHKNCVSLMELADRVETWLDPSKHLDEAIQKIMQILDSLFPKVQDGGLYPKENEKGLYFFIETALYFSLINERIKASPCQTDDLWQEIFFTCLSICNSEERKQLLSFVKTLPVSPIKLPSSASEIFRKLEESQLFTPYRLVYLFLHFLSRDGKEEGNFNALSNLEILQLWKRVEEFLGVLQHPETIFSLFTGAPIPKQALTSLGNFARSWHGDLLGTSLFLPESYFVHQKDFIKEMTNCLVTPELEPVSQARRRCLVESLALATLQEEPVYLSTLLQFKGFENEIGAGGLFPPGTVIPLSKDIDQKKSSAAAFGRHLHCISYWRYRDTGNAIASKTLATLVCSLFFSLDCMREVTFEVDLPDSLPVELFKQNVPLATVFRLFMIALTSERYREGQQEDQTPVITEKDTDAEKRAKIIIALQKLCYVEPLTKFTEYVDPKPDQTDPLRLKQAIPLYLFIHKLKVAFRQAACAMVRHPAPMKTAIPYDRIEAMEFNLGWQFFSRLKPDHAVGKLLRADCQPVVERIYVQLKPGCMETQGFDIPVTIHGEAKRLQLLMTISEITTIESPHVRLDIKAYLQDSVDRVEICDNIQWPLACPEIQAKELIFLALCKVAFHKQWIGGNGAS
ncbi:MAG: hypothetical protein LLG04_08030 [Parachlamydia sp.]|nr:hypothetical protein [Parachlamydia sp.]